jgi:hypothetical protein
MIRKDVGVTLVDELWQGVEFKTHRYDVNAPGGLVSSYHTYSITTLARERSRSLAARTTFLSSVGRGM